ncbi:MAG: hypothetical protein C0404_04285, partial [Verrucomicrobia bacterium]|nr:hypothetical protein [Verrucomicrobiota bacterium]
EGTASESLLFAVSNRGTYDPTVDDKKAVMFAGGGTGYLRHINLANMAYVTECRGPIVAGTVTVNGGHTFAISDVGSPIYTAVAECYNDWPATGLSDSGVAMTGWITDPNHCGVIRVAAGHGHAGRIKNANGSYTGFALKLGWQDGIRAAPWTRLTDVILDVAGPFSVDVKTGGAISRVISRNGSITAGDDGTVVNTLAVDAGFVGSANAAYYNCTSVDASVGFQNRWNKYDGEWAWFVNCLARPKAGGIGFSLAGSDYGKVPPMIHCASSDGTADDWAMYAGGREWNRANVTFTFVNEAQDDFHLANSDISARGWGVPGLGVDIDGEGRPGPFYDIGADQTVGNHSPMITSGPTATPSSLIPGQVAQFAVSAVDIDSDPVSYSWTFGDGGSASGSNVAHTYGTTGVYVAQVVVSDGTLAQTGTATVVVTGSPNPNGALNSIFMPKSFPVLNDNFDIQSGSLAFNTGDGISMPTMAYGATTYTGRIVTNASGKVVMALFNFGNLAIGNGVSCSVTGNLGLVLASCGNITIGTTISVAGKSAVVTNSVGFGGPGAEGGIRKVSFASAPPGNNRGNGDTGSGSVGFGGGGNNRYNGQGGGYGGAGGDGGYSSGGGSTQPLANFYGDKTLTDLFGGSGGGCIPYPHAWGGGGGGALELVAMGNLTITASGVVNVSGGAGGSAYSGGGGGSGGGVLFAADSIAVNGAVYAKGGNNAGGGGGGGGGRIAFYANTLSVGPSVSVAGGTSAGAWPGSDGTIFVGSGFRISAGVDAYGINDSWKILYFGSATGPGTGALDDPDGDGMTNYAEWVAGTNPASAGSRFQCSVFGVQGGAFRLGFQTVIGRTYGVLAKSDLAGTSPWVVVSNGIAGTGGYVEVTDPVSSARRFYRITVR